MDFVKYWLRPRRAIAEALGLGLAACVAAAGARAQDESASHADLGPIELVERFAEEVEDLTASFQQDVFDVDHELLESSTGQFQLLRPNRFAWYYATPYEYEIVADGESLWTYDVEVEQITVDALSNLAESPAMLLSGAGRVSENFTVRDVESIDGRRWIELSPREDEDESEFVSAKIAFRDGLPEALELVDGLSKLTRIEFSDIEINAGLRRRDFNFDPPAGVDVVGDVD